MRGACMQIILKIGISFYWLSPYLDHAFSSCSNALFQLQGVLCIDDSDQHSFLACIRFSFVLVWMVIKTFLIFADDGQDIDGLPNEGVEITCFHLVIFIFHFLYW